MHALGYFHTHQRHDRDDHVKVHTENAKREFLHAFEKCGKPSKSDCNVFGVKYDCGSIMHYAADQFSKNGKDTMSKMKPLWINHSAFP